MRAAARIREPDSGHHDVAQPRLRIGCGLRAAAFFAGLEQREEGAELVRLDLAVKRDFFDFGDGELLDQIACLPGEIAERAGFERQLAADEADGNLRP